MNNEDQTVKNVNDVEVDPDFQHRPYSTLPLNIAAIVLFMIIAIVMR